MATPEASPSDRDRSVLSSLDLEAFDVPAFRIDHASRIRGANQAFCRLIEKDKSQLLGRHCYTLVYSRNCDCFKQRVDGSLRPIIGIASTAHSPLVREIVLPLRTQRSRPSYVVFLVPDVDTHTDLNRFFQAQKLASLGVLAAGVAHELRNPLAIISTSLYFLADVLSSEDPVVDKHLRIMQEEVESARRTIEELLNFARPSTETEAPVDVNHVVRDILSLLDKELVRSDIEVRTDLQTIPLPVTNIDATKHAFLNIVTNAIQAMPNGGQLIVHSRTDRLESGEQAVVVSFTDTGCGMTEEQLAHAFDPFYTTKPDGTGLGLAVTYANIRRLGGNLRITSEPGQGTTVEVILPLGGPNGALENPSG